MYVKELGMHSIEKCTSEGVLVSKWGTNGTGDGQFQLPMGVEVASDGSVYVVDYTHHIIGSVRCE